MNPEIHEVPILLWERSPLSSPEPEAPRLRYERRRYRPNGANAQPLLANRDVLCPEIDLNQYDCSAVFDWLQTRESTRQLSLGLCARPLARLVSLRAAGELGRLSLRLHLHRRGAPVGHHRAPAACQP